MLQAFRQRMKDVRTVRALCEGAERHALADGQDEPGAEHFLLASLDLPDGSARRAFERVRADPDALRAAIAQQHADALRRVGLCDDDADDSGALAPPARALYSAKPSARSVMQQLVAQRQQDGSPALLGAHVVHAVASLSVGTAPRALGRMGIDPAALRVAAQAEIRGEAG